MGFIFFPLPDFEPREGRRSHPAALARGPELTPVGPEIDGAGLLVGVFEFRFRLGVTLASERFKLGAPRGG